VKMKVQEAAKLMGVSPLFLQLSLRENKFPFGTAVKFKRWSYYINAERFRQYMQGK